MNKEEAIKRLHSLEKYFSMIFCYGTPNKFLPLGTNAYSETTPIPWVNFEVVMDIVKQIEGEKENA